MISLEKEETVLTAAFNSGFILFNLFKETGPLILRFPKGVNNLRIRNQFASRCAVFENLAVCALRRDIYIWNLGTGS